MKFGLDYRRLRPEYVPVGNELVYIFVSLPNVLANTLPEAAIISRTASTLVFSNWSLFAQDTWKATRTLTITYGLRWEYDGAPSSPNGTLPFTVTQVNNLATTTLAPPGTPLWTAQKDDFAPRLGVAWQPLANLVFRAGAGIFYDLGYSGVANGTGRFPFSRQNLVLNASYPLSAAAATPPPFTTTPPVSYLSVVDPNHVLPRTYEWNAAVERNFGRADILSVTYLGAAGRKLMRTDNYDAPNPNFTGEFTVMKNEADSSYNALQVQYRHRLAHGLQTLLSYTWAHAIDDASSDAYPVNLPANDATSVPGAWLVRLRHPAHVLGRNFIQHSSAQQRNLEGNLRQLVDGFHRLRSQRAPSERRNWAGPLPFRVHRHGISGRSSSEPGSWNAALDRRSKYSWRAGNQFSRIHDTRRCGAGRSGTKRPARIRRYECRFDAAEAVQTPGAAFSSGASGSFQHLQPPQLRQPHQLSELSAIRPIDADAGSLARNRRPVAASIRCIKSADHAPLNWPSSSCFERHRAR